MQHWIKAKEGKIKLKTDCNGLDERVLSIKVENGAVRFREECDQCFYEEYSYNDAKGLLQEAMDFINDEIDRLEVK